jgi:hypothetical protein
MENESWEPLPHPLVIDSGAAETVIPKKWCENHQMKASWGSQNGVFYTAANGETIDNEGEKTLTMATKDWQTRQMTFQVADVSKALGSVSKICSNGNRCVFDDEGSYIQNKLSGEKLWMRQQDRVYVLDVDIAPPENDRVFPGQAR